MLNYMTHIRKVNLRPIIHDLSLDALKVIRSNNHISDNELNDLFIIACFISQMRVATWIHSLNVIRISTMNNAFLSVCNNKNNSPHNLATAKWIYSASNKQIDLGIADIMGPNAAFRIACISNNLKVAKWVYKKIKGLITYDEMHLTFVLSCQTDIRVPKWLYSFGQRSKQSEPLRGNPRGAINIHYQEESPFISACSSNNVPVLDWLLSLPTGPLINMNACKNRAFIQTCENGHLRVAKWIFQQTGTIIDTECRNRAFLNACRAGRLNVIKWLHSLGSIDIHADTDEAFAQALMNKHIEVAKWLSHMGHIDISGNRLGHVLSDMAYYSPIFYKGLQRLAEEFD